MPVYSRDLARHYDQLMQQYSLRFTFIQNLINNAFPKKNDLRVLELGCGSGNILRQLPATYTLYGLDLSPHMIKIAKKKIPRAKFVIADMSNFAINAKFDLILCMFDSINHLQKIHQWEKVLQLAAKHLNPHGVLLFDMITLTQLQKLSSQKPTVKRLDKNTIAFRKLTQSNKNIFNLQLLLFEESNTKNISVFEEYITESSFEIEKVKEKVRKYFSIETMLDPINIRVRKNTTRVYFVCRK